MKLVVAPIDEHHQAKRIRLYLSTMGPQRQPMPTNGHEEYLHLDCPGWLYQSLTVPADEEEMTKQRQLEQITSFLVEVFGMSL